MKASVILELLAKGHIEELTDKLRDEIYSESLKSKTNAKKRYSAMKKYFKYVSSAREAFQKPCIVEYNGSEFISFCNSYSLVLTAEGCGEIKLFDTNNGNYPDVTRLINYDGKESKIDFSDVIARAKSQGYKLNKSSVNGNEYLMLYDGSYYRIGLLESTYGIIDDGSEATVYHISDSNKPLVIKNDIGICVVMPIRYEGESNDGIVVIEV